MPRLMLVSVAIVALVAIGGCSRPGAPAQAPLVADFRQFCIDTQLQPDAVKAAAARAGAKPVVQSGFAAPSTQNWDHAASGHHVALRLAMAPDAGGAVSNEAVCTVSDEQDGGASLKAVRAWVGAPAGDGNFEQYYFTLDNGQPRYVPRESLSPLRARVLTGGLYRLSLASFDNSTALTLQN